MTPPKSLMTAVGVKKRPSAMIFRMSSMLMKITKTYSPIWNTRWPRVSNACLFAQPTVQTASPSYFFFFFTCSIGTCMTLVKGDSNIMEMQEQMVTTIMTQSK